MQEHEELIKTREVAALLGINTISLSLWMNGHLKNKGDFEIAPAYYAGRAYLWRRSEVEEFAGKLKGKSRKYNPAGCARYYDCDE